jgi:hypothetical protein
MHTHRSSWSSGGGSGGGDGGFLPEDDEEEMSNLPPGRMSVRRGSLKHKQLTPIPTPPPPSSFSASTGALPLPLPPPPPSASSSSSSSSLIIPPPGGPLRVIPSSPVYINRMKGTLSVPPQLQSILKRRLLERSGSSSSGLGGGPVADDMSSTLFTAGGGVGGGGRSSRHSSRSVSPSVRDKATASTYDANSSISSLEDFVEDLLTDRAGLEELDPNAESLSRSSSKLGLHGSGRDFHSHQSGPTLPSVNERMSEDALEDVHAFKDLTISATSGSRSSNASRAGNSSIATGQGGVFLEPLDEEEGTDFDTDSEGDNLLEGGKNGEFGDNKLDGTSSAGMTQVILTNIETLTLRQDDAVDDEDGGPHGATRATGESSLMGEAPTVPTA